MMLNLKSLESSPIQLERVGQVLSLPEIEKHLGVEIPMALHDCLSVYGGQPIQFGVTVGFKPQSKPAVVSKEYMEVGVIYGFNKGSFGLLELVDTYKNRVDDVLIPIADAGAGNQYFWNSETGAVYFWHHECPCGEGSDEALTLVSGTIDKFLDGVVVVEEDLPDDSQKGNFTPGAFDFLLD